MVLAMAGLLTACGSRVWGDDSEISTALAFGEAEECTQNAKTREDTIVKISDCLSEQVPEIDDWAAYVDLKSDGQAYLYQGVEFEFKVYECLKQILDNDEIIACEALKEYLQEKWYEIHRECAWYDSHKSSKNDYYGYWSFEAGAIAKILNLDDSSLKDVAYYPYDLVHYKK